jgi:hypothetical protein
MLACDRGSFPVGHGRQQLCGRDSEAGTETYFMNNISQDRIDSTFFAAAVSAPSSSNKIITASK